MKLPLSSKKPNGPDDWMTLSFELQNLFDGAPIDEEALFAGRTDEVKRILEAVFARSKHVVLFGEKGVEKTSLSNIFWKRFNKITRGFVVARVQAGPHDTFSSLWLRALEELKVSGIMLRKDEYKEIEIEYDQLTPTIIRREFQKCGAGSIPIVIIDEYDKIIDENAKLLTAHLIKELYDWSISTTAILVGVSESITDLIGNHPSTDRAIIEISLSRMSDAELKEIIQKRISRTVI